MTELEAALQDVFRRLEGAPVRCERCGRDYPFEGPATRVTLTQVQVGTEFRRMALCDECREEIQADALGFDPGDLIF